VPWAELDGQVARQVHDGGLGGAIAVRREGVADAADANARHRPRHHDVARVGGRRARLQQRREALDRVEHGLHVEVHDLGEGGVRMRVERRAPGGAGVGQQDVDVRRVRLHLRHQPVDFAGLAAVGRHGDGDGARRAVRQLVQRRARLLAGFRFARCDEDFGAAGLQEPAMSDVSVTLRIGVARAGLTRKQRAAQDLSILRSRQQLYHLNGKCLGNHLA